MVKDKMLDHIIVVYKNVQYKIYVDEVVYSEGGGDVPELIFKLRDTYCAQFK